MQKKPNITLILDTHAFLWVMNGDKGLSQKAKEALVQALEAEKSIGVCAISLWEISMLQARKKILLNQPCLNWIEKSLKAPGIVLCPISPEIAVESSTLSEDFHGDPADRMIVATARILEACLITRDEKLLAYSQNGYLDCIKA